MAFEACVMVDYEDLISDTVTKVTDTDCIQPARASTDQGDTEYKHFKFSETIDGATTAAGTAGPDTNSNCGAYKDVSLAL